MQIIKLPKSLKDPVFKAVLNHEDQPSILKIQKYSNKNMFYFE